MVLIPEKKKQHIFHSKKLKDLGQLSWEVILIPQYYRHNYTGAVCKYLLQINMKQNPLKVFIEQALLYSYKFYPIKFNRS